MPMAAISGSGDFRIGDTDHAFATILIMASSCILGTAIVECEARDGGLWPVRPDVHVTIRHYGVAQRVDVSACGVVATMSAEDIVGQGLAIGDTVSLRITGALLSLESEVPDAYIRARGRDYLARFRSRNSNDQFSPERVVADALRPLSVDPVEFVEPAPVPMLRRAISLKGI